MADELQDLRDRIEIGDLLARYSTALDAREWELLGEVFTPDATCDYGTLGRPRGVEEITALIRGTIGDLDATQHLVGNVVVRVDGDEASADCYLISQHVRAGTPGGDHYLLGGRYADHVVRTPAGWRIAHRTLHRTWTSGNRDVVRRPGRS
ncbi:nuclear transport factor 2 family protein [Trujillonella humicola]|uniref:nuclear transport factor 2 family protein n=1 Tax=Trujillonella humicola TaxID=3383699 RepID=UPI003906AA7E